MEKIVKRINGLIHTSGCNLRCDYCYLLQSSYKNDGGVKALRYPLSTILHACSKERLGGTCMIEIIGDGETLLPNDVVDLICGLLKEGHYVLVINNGTLRERIHELLERAEEDGTLSHLLFSFSLHFLELEKRNLLEVFADNINYVRAKGVSFSISMVCGDNYIEAADRIHRFCDKELGGISLSVSAARKCDNTVGVLSKDDKETYFKKIRETFPSYNFEYTSDYEKIDNRKFCYAGSWCFSVDFTTGIYTQCLRNPGPRHNFFEQLNYEMLIEPVGTGCRAPYCGCGWAKVLNLIPGQCGYIDLEEIASAPEHRFMNKEALGASHANLAETNREYTDAEKETSRRKRMQQEYFTKQVDLLRFDFKEEKYLKFIEGAEVLLEQDLDPRLLDVVWLVVRYGYALIRSGQAQRALDLESCYDDLKYNADYCYVMGLIYMNNAMWERAIGSFLEVTKKSFVIDDEVNDSCAYYNIGVIYECLGNKETARQYYLKCKDYEPAKRQLEGLGM